MNDTNSNTRPETDRTSVRMWPGITAGLVIGLIAFILSFDALRLVFVSCGINPYLSWGGPVCVDGTILLCTWATWGFKKGHIRGGWYPWAGLVLFSGCSIGGNALHALINNGLELPAWAPATIMSIPPVAMLYATHLIVIIAGDRLDKVNALIGRTLDDTETKTPTEPMTASTAEPLTAPSSAPVPSAPANARIRDGSACIRAGHGGETESEGLRMERTHPRRPRHRRHGGRCLPKSR